MNGVAAEPVVLRAVETSVIPGGACGALILRPTWSVSPGLHGFKGYPWTSPRFVRYLPTTYAPTS